MIRTTENILEYWENLNKYFVEKKKEKWCNKCHCKEECEDKEEFLKSDNDLCPWFV